MPFEEIKSESKDVDIQIDEKVNQDIAIVNNFGIDEEIKEEIKVDPETVKQPPLPEIKAIPFKDLINKDWVMVPV